MNHNGVIEKTYKIFCPTYFLHETGTVTGAEEDNTKILEQYFNDLYKLFLSKLSSLDNVSTVDASLKKRLRSLLDELIYVKTVLTGEGNSEK